MKNLPYAKLSKGSLLIASPEVDAGPFHRCVILLCDNNSTGSFGLILNQSIEVHLPEEVLNLSEANNPNIRLLSGGPVQANQMLILHSSPESPSQTSPIVPGVYLGGDLSFLQKLVIQDEDIHISLCFGYAGWGAGQLEREYLDGGWFLTPGNFEKIFQLPTESMWKHLLKDLGGKYATFSTMPDDLSVN